MQNLNIIKQQSPLTQIGNKHCEVELTVESLEPKLLACFLKQFSNKENLRAQRNISGLNFQLQKLKTGLQAPLIPTYVFNKSQTQPQMESPKTDSRKILAKVNAQLPLTTLQKKLEAIERCMANEFSTRKNKRQQMTRQDVRQKAISVYCKPNEEEPVAVTNVENQTYMPFSFYQFGEDPVNISAISNINEDCEIMSHSQKNKELEDQLVKEQQNVLQLKSMMEKINSEKVELLDIIKKLRKDNNICIDKINTIQQSQDTQKLAQKQIILNDQQVKLIQEKEKLIININNFELRVQEQDKREINMNTLQASYIQDLKNMKILKKGIEQDRQQHSVDKLNMEGFQSKINKSIQQVFQVNRNELNIKIQDQLGFQIEAVEIFMQATQNEQRRLQQKDQYLQQLKDTINEEKSELLKLRKKFE